MAKRDLKGACIHGLFSCDRCGSKKAVTVMAAQTTATIVKKAQAKPAPAKILDGPLTEETARALTDEFKRDAASLWKKLGRLYDGEAHVKLGYPSWGDYLENEFNIAKSRGYRLLAAARVEEAIESQSPIGDSPIFTESQARELVPLLAKPEEIIEVLESIEGVTTADKLHDAVTPHLPKAEQKKREVAKRKRTPKPMLDTVPVLRTDLQALLGGTADGEVMTRCGKLLG